MERWKVEIHLLNAVIHQVDLVIKVEIVLETFEIEESFWSALLAWVFNKILIDIEIWSFGLLRRGNKIIINIETWRFGFLRLINEILTKILVHGLRLLRTGNKIIINIESRLLGPLRRGNKIIVEIKAHSVGLLRGVNQIVEVEHDLLEEVIEHGVLLHCSDITARLFNNLLESLGGGLFFIGSLSILDRGDTGVNWPRKVGILNNFADLIRIVWGVNDVVKKVALDGLIADRRGDRFLGDVSNCSVVLLVAFINHITFFFEDGVNEGRSLIGRASLDGDLGGRVGVLDDIIDLKLLSTLDKIGGVILKIVVVREEFVEAFKDLLHDA